MKTVLMRIVAVAGVLALNQAQAQLTVYEHDGFQGRTFSTDRAVIDFQRVGFNDIASSVIIDAGRWEVCEDAGFSGQCFVLDPGQYPSLGAFGMNDKISSVRPVGRQVPPPSVGSPRYEYYPRHGEQLYTAEVTSVRAVVSGPQQRCWVEPREAGYDRSPNVPGAIVGGILGGILGHQIGNGRGQDVATAVGAIGGAAVGANAGRTDGGQDVQRCTSMRSSTQPDYWDVTYVFRGLEHRVQMRSPPGPTIAVNEAGEPRM